MLLLPGGSGLWGAPRLGRVFSYRGRWVVGASPANGQYDLELTLFNVLAGPGQVGRTLTNANVAVSNGLFTTGLDFGGGTFDSTAYLFWIDGGDNRRSVGFFSVLTGRALSREL